MFPHLSFPFPHLSMFLAMVIIHVFVMPYVMVAQPDHVYFSVTQGWLGLFMGACMIAIEGAMHPMPWWAWILTVALGTAAVIGYRKQWLVTDREFLHDMIPHHSMALVTATNRQESPDPIISRLAQTIVTTQAQEIDIMKYSLGHGREGQTK